MKLKTLAVSLMLAIAPFAQGKELKSIGVTVGDLANPFFVQITKGAELKAKELAGDQVKVTLASSGYDLGQQVAQIDNFIAAKTDMIILNAADSKGIGPAVLLMLMQMEQMPQSHQITIKLGKLLAKQS